MEGGTAPRAIMTIDMHSHWFPEKLADAFRQRKSKPMIHTKDGVEYMESMFSAPLRTEKLEKRLEGLRTDIPHGIGVDQQRPARIVRNPAARRQ